MNGDECLSCEYRSSNLAWTHRELRDQTQAPKEHQTSDWPLVHSRVHRTTRRCTLEPPEASECHSERMVTRDLRSRRSVVRIHWGAPHKRS
jgi:hypothetical protein